MELKKGQKLKLTEQTADNRITLSVSARINAGEADCTCFGVDAEGKLSDDRYFVFYNQTSTPEEAVSMHTEQNSSIFSVELKKLPQKIQRLVITIAADGEETMKDISEGQLTLSGCGLSADYSFSGESFSQEKALILCELYRKDGIWRCGIVSDGFNGGLSALLAHFGGEEKRAPSPAPKPEPMKAPTPSPENPKVDLSKISLKKGGDSHKINLKKNSGEIHVNLNWTAGRKRFLSGATDLDLACMYRLKNGQQGVVQALGNSFGNANDYPFILLDADDRTGNSKNGENMYFKRPELIDFAVVFAYIYEGAPNWRDTNAIVVLHQQNAPDIEISIDNASSRSRFCVLASLSGSNGELEVKREERFFSGHREVDKYYHFGFRWVGGRK